MVKKLLVSLVVGFVGLTAHAQQSREDILKQQQSLQKELTDLNNTYNEIKKNKKQSLSQLALVQRKIRAREDLVNNLSRDLRQIDDNIYLTTLEMNRMRRELDTLKENYAKSLVFAYKNRSNYDYLNFIFSATSFNDAFKRVAYLKSYRQYRETQADNIVKTQSVLQQKAGYLASSKVEKNSALKEQGKQLEVLEEDKKEKDRVVQDLKDKETDIAAEIKSREKTRQKLGLALQAVIRREREEAQRRAIELAKKQKEEEDRKKREADALAKANANKPNNNTANAQPSATAPQSAAPSVKKDEPVKAMVSTGVANRKYDPLESTTEGLTQSLNFENNKGRLPWPADAGVVIIPFGTYTIPGTKLKGISDGIVIALPVGASIKSVADGEVSAITDIGGEQVVILIHGKYFTTYSNLSTVNVSSGQKVKAGTILGKAAEGTSTSGEGQITFMVTNERGNQNPESWLRRK